MIKDGAVIWVTGLAGCGKTTLCERLHKKLKEKYKGVVLLDGDISREILYDRYDYSAEDRLKAGRKYADLANFLAKEDLIVICATISAFDEIYKENREKIKNYYEVYVKCPMEELIKRDKKGLYSGALKGEIKEVVGVDIKYIEPKEAHFVLDNSKLDEIEKKAESLYLSVEKFLESKERI